MARLLTVLLVLVVLACAFAAPSVTDIAARPKGHAQASEGSIGVGNISGGRFGESSFSIGAGGKSEGQGDAGHGGNYGTNSYGGPGGDAGNTRYS